MWSRLSTNLYKINKNQHAFIEQRSNLILVNELLNYSLSKTINFVIQSKLLTIHLGNKKLPLRNQKLIL